MHPSACSEIHENAIVRYLPSLEFQDFVVLGTVGRSGFDCKILVIAHCEFF